MAVLMCVGMSTACQKEEDVSLQSADNPRAINDKLLVNSTFATGAEGWVGDYTDYSTAQEGIMEFQFKHESLPAPLDRSKKSLLLSGHNRSDDLFLFIKRKVTGLRPSTTYRLVFEIELASKYPTASFGIGGSPGNSVFLKVGATAVEPQKEKMDNFYGFNLDKGFQSSGGKDMMVLGTIGIKGEKEEYELIQRSNAQQPFAATTNDKGEIWLTIGTDSGFEGLTTLYYSRVKVMAL